MSLKKWLLLGKNSDMTILIEKEQIRPIISGSNIGCLLPSHSFHYFVPYPGYSIPTRNFSTAFFSILDTYSPVKLGLKIFGKIFKFQSKAPAIALLFPQSVVNLLQFFQFQFPSHRSFLLLPSPVLSFLSYVPLSLFPELPDTH